MSAGQLRCGYDNDQLQAATLQLTAHVNGLAFPASH